jgi:SAM-dependent methyltransferase
MTSNLKRQTASGDYPLPSRFYCGAANFLLRTARWVPPAVRARFIRQRSFFYQTFNQGDPGNHEGLSIRKWEAMRMPPNLTGKSVLDIGCAEGFFCRLSAISGAAPVVGIDTSLGRLLCASFMALQERIRIHYRMSVFPGHRVAGKYDYVLCLSVMHHSLSSRDLWKILTLDEFAPDRLILREQVRLLRSLTDNKGKCIVEMPYEYDDAVERDEVDFKLFNRELTEAGFARAECLGSWDYNPKFKDLKDRVIYVAEAS